MKKLSFIQRNDKRHWVGDGFPVRSVFSYSEVGKELSPFLLLDYAGPATFPPSIERRGVGAHPHRGFETVTIVYSGEVEHRDSSGGGGIIGPGDVQWMTAASGIVHEEFHGPGFAKRGGPFETIQLWVNLPAKDKKADPTYQSIADAQIPRIGLLGNAGAMRIIAGKYRDQSGPARTFSPINLWDARLNMGHRMEFQVPRGHTTALFISKGRIRLPDGELIGEAELAVFDRKDDTVVLETLANTSALVLTGEPIDEPIVGYGPFIMNTKAEVQQAFADYESGRMGHIAV